MRPSRRYVVVGNQTLGGERLLERIRELRAAGPSEFHLVVPATPPHEHAFWSEGEAVAIARRRLTAMLDRLHAEGISATGEVGDPNPVMAVEDALRDESFDEIILSTLPVRISRWMHLDLTTRLARRTGLPVMHIEAGPVDVRALEGEEVQP